MDPLVFIYSIVSKIVKITVGHTPDSDDAFMFYGMLEGRVPSPGFEVEHVIGDISSLNSRALGTSLDVTAASVHACAYAPGYAILRSGGSFGLGYGPIIIGRGMLDMESVKNAKIAVPGEMTSAFLLLRLMIGKFDYAVMDFDRIPEAVRSGAVDVGVAIHETQLSHAEEGVVRILDLGEWWNDSSGGLPVPLGVNLMKASLGADTIRRFDQYLQDSIQYGLDHMDDAIDYAMKYSRGKPRRLIEEFVRMYVNDVTVNMGSRGESSIRMLFQMAARENIMPFPALEIAPAR